MFKLHLLCIFSTISTVFGGTPGTPAAAEVNFMKTAINEFVTHGARLTISLVVQMHLTKCIQIVRYFSRCINYVTDHSSMSLNQLLIDEDLPLHIMKVIGNEALMDHE